MYYSHKGILLNQHLKQTGELAYNKAKSLQISTKHCWIPDVARIIGYCHDFGKYTSFFQRHLENEENDLKSHHSMLSALFCVHQIKWYFEKTNYSVEDSFKNFIPLISYIVVYRHHGDLKSPDEIIPSQKSLSYYPNLKNLNSSIRDEIKVLSLQLDDIKNNFKVIKEEISEFNFQKLDEFLTLNTIFQIFYELDRLKYDLFEKNILSEADRIKLYFLVILFFSLLIDSDKKSAGRIQPVEVERKQIPSVLVDIYREKAFKNCEKEIDLMRDEIYKVVTKKVEEIPLEQRLFTLTAPTGSGKTLTVFSFALKLRERIEKETGKKPRIIYSLPFVNIIEQNYDVFKEVLSELSEYSENESLFLIKHHYLSSIEYKEGNQFKPVDEALMLIESWESEIIVTTFVQLLHSVIAFKNNFLKKFQNIANSILILDEVQNIPIEYWELVGVVLQHLVEFFDCRLILMTATKPLILTSKNTLELLDKEGKYFSSLNRVRLIPKIEDEMDENEFIEWFKEIYNQSSSYLIVVNTISKSKSIYRLLKKKFNFEGFKEIELGNRRSLGEINLDEFLRDTSKKIFYLSTNIIPIQRSWRIKVLKEFLKREGKPVLISTQVIEAGVDLDFDVVIRDIGPLDSIIQCAGRCNRNGIKDQKGIVYVINLKEGGVENVYGKIHPLISKRLLFRNEVDEKSFYNIVEFYYKEVINKISSDESKQIYNAILNLNFFHNSTKSIADFKIIKEEGQFYDIYIELDEKSKEIRNDFVNSVIEEKDFIKKKNNYLKLKKDFYSYLIQVRKGKILYESSFIKRLWDTEILYLPYEYVEYHYDFETGFKSFDENTPFIW